MKSHYPILQRHRPMIDALLNLTYLMHKLHLFNFDHFWDTARSEPKAFVNRMLRP